MSYKATKPSLVSVLYLSICYMVSLFIRAPFYVLLVFIAMCADFWLFWLSYQYLPSGWLERLVCAPIFLCFLGQLSHLLTVFGTSVTNLNEHPRALATTTIMWIRSWFHPFWDIVNESNVGEGGYYVAGRPLLNGRCTSLLKGPVSEMTYTVLSWTLNSTIPYHAIPVAPVSTTYLPM